MTMLPIMNEKLCRNLFIFSTFSALSSFPLLIGCTGIAPSGFTGGPSVVSSPPNGAINSSVTPQATTGVINKNNSISSVTLVGKILTITGNNLNSIKSVKISDKDGPSLPFNIQSQTNVSLSGNLGSSLNFIAGSLYSLIITDAIGDTYVPLNVNISSTGSLSLTNSLSVAGNIAVGSADPASKTAEGLSFGLGPLGVDTVNSLAVFPYWDPHWLYLNAYATKDLGLGISFSNGIKLVGNVLISGSNLNYITPAQTELQVMGVISPAADNTFSLGNSSFRFTTIYATNSVVNTSDAREKRDIVESDLGLDFINHLRPVSYHWKSGADHDLHYGLIAQETEKFVTELHVKSSGENTPIVDYDKKADRYGIKYNELISPLIKAVQEMFSDFKKSQDRMAQLELENSQLKSRLERLEKIMENK